MCRSENAWKLFGRRVSVLRQCTTFKRLNLYGSANMITVSCLKIRRVNDMGMNQFTAVSCLIRGPVASTWWEQLILAQTWGVSNNAIMRHCQQAMGWCSRSWKTLEGWSQDAWTPSGEAPQLQRQDFVEGNRWGKSRVTIIFPKSTEQILLFCRKPPHFSCLTFIFNYSASRTAASCTLLLHEWDNSKSLALAGFVIICIQ